MTDQKRKAMEMTLDSLAECSRLLGSTQAKKGYGIYTADDVKFEVAMYESIYKHKAALRQALAQTEPAIGDIRALKHRIHELEGELIGCKRLLDAQPEQDYIKRLEDDFRQQLDELSQRNYELRHPPKNTASVNKQEPVAWLEYDDEGYLFLSGKRKGAFPVYTAPPSKQEPVAWLVSDAQGRYATIRDPSQYGEEVYEPLYAAPPKREWVGLTDDEIKEGAKYSWVDYQAFQSVAWWADEKLKEKNT